MAAHPRPRSVLAALAVAQIVAWGVLYYAVLVAAPAIADDTGWTEPAVFVAVTTGLLTSAVCAIPVGRWLDRYPRRVLVSGAILATIALLGAAASPNIWAFTAAWIICGAAQSAVLYQAAFTVITHRHQERRRGPLTVVTLAGGLASTIFAPITATLVAQTGWRIAFVILAGVVAAIVIPRTPSPSSAPGLTLPPRPSRTQAHAVRCAAPGSGCCPVHSPCCRSRCTP